MTPRPITHVASKFVLPVLLGLVLSLAAACDSGNKYAPPPPPTVTVSPPVQRDVVKNVYYTGSTEGEQSVEIRARVEGYLQSMHFRPGSRVKKGDLLFIIDPKPYQADLDQALAEVEIKRAGLKLAEATLIRKENAFKDRAVSEVDVIQARAEKAQAEAAIHGAEAAVETARIKLGYTRIQAPIDGVISRNLVDVGNLVGAGEATLLTSIIDDAPMFVYFSISDSDLLNYRQAAREDRAPRDKRGAARVYLGLVNEKGYPHQGYGDFVNNTVDPQTGTILVRAVFPNTDHVLTPGLFVRLRIPVSKQKNALLVPESALGADQSGRYLLTVDEHDVVQYRKVTLGVREKGLREITEGLKAGDRVIIKGLQRARPGIKVTPQTPEQAEAAAKAAKQQGDKSKSQAKTK